MIVEALIYLLAALFVLSSLAAIYFAKLPLPIRVRSCSCGAHWWIRKWGFWRHLDASPFNDQLQNRWTIWLFEFRDVLVLSARDQIDMGYPEGPVWLDGRPMWKESKLEWKVQPTRYCVRCTFGELRKGPG